MILGLSGYKNSGKDTVGAYLVKEHQFERKSFADKLKESASALFNIPVWELEQMKNDPLVWITVSRDIGGRQTPIYKQTVRSMYQRYGTESHRDVFGEDFWVDQLLPVEGFYGGRAIVVTDVRYENEVNRVLKLGGHIVFVDRPGLDYKDPHSSEGSGVSFARDIGYRLLNDGTVDDLFQRIEKMLEELT